MKPPSDGEETSLRGRGAVCRKLKYLFPLRCISRLPALRRNRPHLPAPPPVRLPPQPHFIPCSCALSDTRVTGAISPAPCQSGHPSVNSSAAPTRLRRPALVNTSSCVLHRWGLMSQGWHSGAGNRISRSAPAEPRGKKWAFTSPGNHLAGRSEQGERFENILKCNE